MHLELYRLCEVLRLGDAQSILCRRCLDAAISVLDPPAELGAERVEMEVHHDDLSGLAGGPLVAARHIEGLLPWRERPTSVRATVHHVLDDLHMSVIDFERV